MKIHPLHEPTDDFSGKVALVTGGTSGIGFATAQAFARAGARVALVARGEDAGGKASAALAQQGGCAMFVPADVRDEASVARAIDEVLRFFGRLDYAVNAAGIGGDMAPLEATNQEIWDDVLAVNARGVWLAMRHEIPALLRTGGGAIVNLSAIYGVAGKAAHHATSRPNTPWSA